MIIEAAQVRNGLTRAVVASRQQKGTAMSATDKAKNEAEIAKGKVKEGAGKVTGDQVLEGEGQADQTAGNLKQAGEQVKDTVKKVKDAGK